MRKCVLKAADANGPQRIVRPRNPFFNHTLHFPCLQLCLLASISSQFHLSLLHLNIYQRSKCRTRTFLQRFQFLMCISNCHFGLDMVPWRPKFCCKSEFMHASRIDHIPFSNALQTRIFATLSMYYLPNHHSGLHIFQWQLNSVAKIRVRMCLQIQSYSVLKYIADSNFVAATQYFHNAFNCATSKRLCAYKLVGSPSMVVLTANFLATISYRLHKIRQHGPSHL